MSKLPMTEPPRIGPGDKIRRGLNALPPDAAHAAMLELCHSERWAAAMTAARPFHTEAELLDAADVAFDTLDDDDWRQAFAGHARIGDLLNAGARGRAEQSGTASATVTELQALQAGNAAYEARFGHVFLICASGLPAGTMLAALENRIGNSPRTELAIAAAEQRKITRKRLVG